MVTRVDQIEEKCPSVYELTTVFVYDNLKVVIHEGTSLVLKKNIVNLQLTIFVKSIRIIFLYKSDTIKKLLTSLAKCKV